jgi:hypothetical protein
MLKRKLACSFCGKGEAEVAKLVSGPRVYICDQCAAEAVRIMNSSDGTDGPATSSRRGFAAAVRVRVRALWHGGVTRWVAAGV